MGLFGPKKTEEECWNEAEQYFAERYGLFQEQRSKIDHFIEEQHRYTAGYGNPSAAPVITRDWTRADIKAALQVRDDIHERIRQLTLPSTRHMRHTIYE